MWSPGRVGTWRRGHPVGPVAVDRAIPEAECRRGAWEEGITVSLLPPSTLRMPVANGQPLGEKAWVMLSTRVGTGTERRRRTEDEWQKGN